MNRMLGRSEISVSPLGLGCWAIGGEFTLDGLPDGWGEVDESESIAGIHAALERGVNFFDTADVYGTGHSEAVLGRALRGRRHEAVIATKFGYTYDESTKEAFTRHDVTPEYVRHACERSLRRLQTDYVDMYQIHVGGLSLEEIDTVIDSLNELRQEGLIRTYGWSTWDVANAQIFAQKSEAAAIQHVLNVLSDDKEMLSLCERYGLASINNTPLAMGLLSGKFNHDSRFSDQDVRGSRHEWVTYFKNGKAVPSYLQKLEAVREVLTSGNRTLVQGALAWIWGRSHVTIPIPGFKTRKQVEELIGAAAFGPLSEAQINEVEGILGSS
ncbi:aldo/keto reductase [Paenibacillus glucanolyticus]|uniref:Aldo/keto reductase n=1 Tax=Paenibacillus glucanolyticus TaxID=59843 RepID=A0A163DB60_9BACL|nr:MULTISPECIES: aldo/keto reductase [Paenibacillus]AWP27340.1 aldo/keto reductase [Paenibacillus sp. Cedars]KZS43111.1 aldo/keto reductase [Paenibacillus glucanolyticus]MDH6670753.1 aryl-alcohol dehydrogenase-like predicted oxidoreductase [Paenibacillus sp. LBL]